MRSYDASPTTALSREIEAILPNSGQRASVLLSVLCCVRNGERFVAETIRSIQAQTYTCYEFLIVDDGSEDSTNRIVESFAKDDARIRHYALAHQGIAAARNDAIRLALGDLIAWIDADDIALPLRLEKQVEHLLAHPECVAVGGQWDCIDEKGRYLYRRPAETDSSKIVENLIQGTCELANPATMIRRAEILKAGGYRETGGSEDFDLWLRLMEHGMLCNLNETVLMYRIHASQLSSKHRLCQLSGMINSVNNYRRANGLRALALPFTKANDFSMELYELGYRCWYYGSYWAAVRVLSHSLYANPTRYLTYLALILAAFRIRPQTFSQLRNWRSP